MAPNVSVHELCVANLTPQQFQILEPIISGYKPNDYKSAAISAAGLVHIGLEFEDLASKLTLEWIYSQTENTFSMATDKMYRLTRNDKKAIRLSDEYVNFVLVNSEALDFAIGDQRLKDSRLNYAGLVSLLQLYMIKVPILKTDDSTLYERPQYMFMRTAVAVAMRNGIESVIKTYNMLSDGTYTHATPTLIQSGFKEQQMSSCFLLSVDDTIRSMCNTNTQISLISANGGGIGVDVSRIRGSGSLIARTNGLSPGLLPYLNVVMTICKQVNQGGKRPGSAAVFIEPWHPDVFDILTAKNPMSSDVNKLPDLFLGMWVNDIFMRRVETDADWTLMCPFDCPGLTETYGAEFEELYLRYESEGRGQRVVRAKDLWALIITRLVDCGNPYVMFKDTVNALSNQKNVGVVRSGNLCAEIVEVATTSSDSAINPDLKDGASCNLASVCLSKFVDQHGQFDFDGFRETIYVIVDNLNNVIDSTFSITDGIKNNNLDNRPIGIGIQGLADMFILMGLTFGSPESISVMRTISENMYYAAVRRSCDISKQRFADGVSKPHYPNYPGSPISFKFHHELFDELAGVTTPITLGELWSDLRTDINKYGVYNSMFIALMPTASSALINGNSESFEPYMSNIVARKTLAGEHMIINKHLYRRLKDLGLWDDQMWLKLTRNKGSVQEIQEIPEQTRKLFRMAWEIPQRDCIELALARAPFVDQSQSFSMYFAGDSKTLPARISSALFYGWKNKLKTGIYYMRGRPVDPVNFVGKIPAKRNAQSEDPDISVVAEKKKCTEDVCVLCSS